jgi:2-oxoglutarate ferredoxin oxidoreductase subunit alpha
MADMTGKAFELAMKYRMPAMLLADGTMGQMMEPVVLPEPKDVATEAPAWAAVGTECKREHNIINSLSLVPEELEQLNIERYNKYKTIEENEVLVEEYMTEDADIVLVAYGIAARVSKNAIAAARAEGIKVGLVRPITLWPFPKATLEKLSHTAKAFISVEMSMGQMIEDVELATRCRKPVLLCNRSGGMIPTPEAVLAKIKEAGGIE